MAKDKMDFQVLQQSSKPADTLKLPHAYSKYTGKEMNALFHGEPVKIKLSIKND